MNFFDHQENARRQTGRLLVFFTTAVILTVLAVDVGLYFIGFMTGGLEGSWLWHEWTTQALVGTLLMIGGGSLVEYFHLRNGGSAVAEMVGGRRIDFSTRDLHERQFINVVEEMSIASGVPTPMLYVMEREAGINAFVAGLTLQDTVMVVTQGALDTFTREELQAVAGHEFSHILNGDMRLNVRLMALLAGILTLGQIGSFIMRMTGSFRSSRKDDRSGVPQLFIVGMLLWLVGAIGLFFGRLIKAAISRQREFLADASSVQFTRNPDGLASALIKIKNNSERSWLNNIRSESMSHMCFGETLHFSRLFATHPPIEDRITALGREYLVKDRQYQREQRQMETAGQTAKAMNPAPSSGFAVEESAPKDLPPIPFTLSESATPTASILAGQPVGGLNGLGSAVPLAIASGALAGSISSSVSSSASASLGGMTVPAIMESAGTVRPEQLASAQELHKRLPPRVKLALQTSAGAQALLYALMATQSAATPAQMTQFLMAHEPQLVEQGQEILRSLEGLDFSFALPLTELAIPRLQVLPEQHQRQFFARLKAFAWLDGRLSTFEFALLMLLRKQLQTLPRARPVRIEQCLPSIGRMVATLLRTGGTEGVALERSYDRLMRTIHPSIPALPGADVRHFQDFSADLLIMAGLSLTGRRQVLELAATAVLADGIVKRQEYELLRVMAALLDCPMPLLQL